VGRGKNRKPRAPFFAILIIAIDIWVIHALWVYQPEEM